MEFPDPGAMLSATHELEDGSRVRLRLTRPSDIPRLAALVDGELQTRRFAFYDPRERVAIAATRPGAGGEEIVGLARADLNAADRPEVVVAHDVRPAGLRRLLAQAVTTLADHRRRRAA